VSICSILNVIVKFSTLYHFTLEYQYNRYVFTKFNFYNIYMVEFRGGIRDTILNICVVLSIDNYLIVYKQGFVRVMYLVSVE